MMGFRAAIVGDQGWEEQQGALVVAPDVFNTYVINRLPFITLKSHEHLLEGFRKAGWQG